MHTLMLSEGTFSLIRLPESVGWPISSYLTCTRHLSYTVMYCRYAADFKKLQRYLTPRNQSLYRRIMKTR